MDLSELFGLAAEIGQGLLGIFSEKVRLFNMIANDQEFQSRVGDVVRLGANVTNSAARVASPVLRQVIVTQ